VDGVVIVGAGPAGLAAAATLRARGIDATIIERGRVGEPWRSRYDRLHLHTIRSLSHLPGYRIPRDFGRWVARDQFVQYLEQYVAHHHLTPTSGVEATHIDRDNGHWSVRTTTGTIPARVVVVATGFTRLPHVPRWPGTFDGPIVHSMEYRNPRPYRDQDVLVVGAGNSGTEIAVDLADGGAARVRIAVRTPPNILRPWPMDHACFQTPSWRPPATTPHSGRLSVISQRSASTVFQAHNHVCISSECAYRSPGSCMKSAWMPG
jgi:putative flavoprotein involved in K+ transport